VAEAALEEKTPTTPENRSKKGKRHILRQDKENKEKARERVSRLRKRRAADAVLSKEGKKESQCRLGEEQGRFRSSHRKPAKQRLRLGRKERIVFALEKKGPNGALPRGAIESPRGGKKEKSPLRPSHGEGEKKKELFLENREGALASPPRPSPEEIWQGKRRGFLGEEVCEREGRRKKGREKQASTSL